MNKPFSPKQKDNRYFPRWDIEHRVFFREGFDGDLHEAKSLDLSCSGMSFKTDEEVKLGQKIKMTLYINLDKHLELTGIVIWINEYRDYKEVGVQFYNTTDEAQDMILDHAFEINRKHKINDWFKDWQNL